MNATRKANTWEMTELLNWERRNIISPVAVVREAILAEVFIDETDSYKESTNRDTLSPEEKEILEYWEEFWGVKAL